MDHNDGKSYVRFGAMIGTSMLVMFGLMYLNTYALDHVRWSETRFYMTFIMGAAMAIVMLSFMLGMYRNARVNVAIFAASAVVFRNPFMDDPPSQNPLNSRDHNAAGRFANEVIRRGSGGRPADFRRATGGFAER